MFTTDFCHERERMVTWQIERRGVFDPNVLAAMRTIPRHLFVPDGYQDEAYADYPLPIGYEQTISQPYIVALMSSLLELPGNGKVLEIGTGSGYQAAVLSLLAQTVVSLESIPSLAKMAKQNLEKCAIDNVDVVCQDGSVGYLKESPYQGIVVAACAPGVPDELLEQLDLGGTLVIPVGDQSTQVLQIWKKSSTGELSSMDHIPVVFVPLKGEKGFKD